MTFAQAALRLPPWRHRA